MFRVLGGTYMKKIVFSLFLANILLFTACSTDPSEEIKVPEETEENVVKSTDEIELKKHVEDLLSPNDQLNNIVYDNGTLTIDVSLSNETDMAKLYDEISRPLFVDPSWKKIILNDDHSSETIGLTRNQAKDDAFPMELIDAQLDK